ncbi:MAG: sodium:calcium antiporter [Proteobacteria bacterium]|nr:MAG: sodium:calcium antiporter [Pseudomonadota bacterium]
MLNAFLLLCGIGLLAVGGEALIRGALGLAERLAVSPLLTGLVIVGFGTSMPELVVSVDAVRSGQPDIAIGNVVGSNIGNVLLVLGLCAVITPLTVTPLSLRRDALSVIAVSLLFIMLTHNGLLSRLDALIFLVILVLYLLWAYWSEWFEATLSATVYKAESEVLEKVPKSLAWSISAVVIGLILMITGSQVLLKGAVGMAHAFAVSEAVIGLTLVAVGTSLPELSISVIAAIRGHADVAVGNILGSNMFNLLAILGVSALIQPMKVTERVLDFDQWVMLGAAVLLLIFLWSGRRLNRLEGGLLLIGYIGYIAASYLVFGN